MKRTIKQKVQDMFVLYIILKERVNANKSIDLNDALNWYSKLFASKSKFKNYQETFNYYRNELLELLVRADPETYKAMYLLLEQLKYLKDVFGIEDKE